MTQHDQRSIQYIDANNLYGNALKQKLPYKEFSCVNESLEKVLYTSGDGAYGYWVICDINCTYNRKDNTRS